MQELPDILVSAIKEQKAVLFLGAGASYGAHHPQNEKVPTGNQLRDAICSKFFGGKLNDRPLAEVAALAASDAGLANFQLYLRNIFKSFSPAEHHKIIPKFRWHSIVTTNYDLLIEEAYEQTTKRLQNLVVRTKDGDQFDNRLNSTNRPLGYLKLHGCIDHYADESIPLIISGEQYVTFSAHRSLMYSRFHELCLQYVVIFAGYSIQDAHIQKFVLDAEGPAKSRPMFFRIDPKTEEVEKRYWSAKRAPALIWTSSPFWRRLIAKSLKLRDE